MRMENSTHAFTVFTALFGWKQGAKITILLSRIPKKKSKSNAMLCIIIKMEVVCGTAKASYDEVINA